MQLPFFTKVFLTQFEPHGDGWLYRESSRGVPKFVTTAEKNRMATTYSLWLIPIILGALIVVIASTAIAYTIAPDSEIWGVAIGMLAFAGYLFVTIRWVTYAPTRALVNRPPLGPVRTRAEVIAMVKERERRTGSVWG